MRGKIENCYELVTHFDTRVNKGDEGMYDSRFISIFHSIFIYWMADGNCLCKYNS